MLCTGYHATVRLFTPGRRVAHIVNNGRGVGTVLCLKSKESTANEKGDVFQPKNFTVAASA